jgi:hypothetical protein
LHSSRYVCPLPSSSANTNTLNLYREDLSLLLPGPPTLQIPLIMMDRCRMISTYTFWWLRSQRMLRCAVQSLPL